MLFDYGSPQLTSAGSGIYVFSVNSLCVSIPCRLLNILEMRLASTQDNWTVRTVWQSALEAERPSSLTTSTIVFWCWICRHLPPFNCQLKTTASSRRSAFTSMLRALGCTLARAAVNVAFGAGEANGWKRCLQSTRATVPSRLNVTELWRRRYIIWWVYWWAWKLNCRLTALDFW